MSAAATTREPELPLPAPAAWTRPKGKGACGRDPEAGPGTCWHWWDGCPRPERRGCYLLWRQTQADAAGRSAA